MTSTRAAEESLRSRGPRPHCAALRRSPPPATQCRTGRTPRLCETSTGGSATLASVSSKRATPVLAHRRFSVVLLHPDGSRRPPVTTSSASPPTPGRTSHPRTARFMVRRHPGGGSVVITDNSGNLPCLDRNALFRYGLDHIDGTVAGPARRGGARSGLTGEILPFKFPLHWPIPSARPASAAGAEPPTWAAAVGVEKELA